MAANDDQNKVRRLLTILCESSEDVERAREEVANALRVRAATAANAPATAPAASQQQAPPTTPEKPAKSQAPETPKATTGSGIHPSTPSGLSEGPHRFFTSPYARQAVAPAVAPASISTIMNNPKRRRRPCGNMFIWPGDKGYRNEDDDEAEDDEEEDDDEEDDDEEE